MAIMGRCMRCNKQVEMVEQEIVITKNGRRMAKGKCPECETVVCKFLPKENKI